MRTGLVARCVSLPGGGQTDAAARAEPRQRGVRQHVESSTHPGGGQILTRSKGKTVSESNFYGREFPRGGVCTGSA